MARIMFPKGNEKLPEEVHCKFLYECNQAKEENVIGWEDMVSMNVLNEPEILSNL